MNCFTSGLAIMVTTESWSNITLNESFANYSETLVERISNMEKMPAMQKITMT